MLAQKTTEDFSKLPLFEGISDHSLTLITPEMISFFEPDEAILVRGAQVKNLVVLLEGEVCVSVDDIFLVSRKAPAVIGEQAFIDEPIHSATVKALGVVKALVLPSETAEQLMKDNTFVQNLLRMVSGKLREATDERARHYRREQLLFSEFRAHASNEMVNRMLATGLNYGEPHYIEDCVVLFSDIRGFTFRSSQMDAADIADQLSSYLDAIVDIIHRHNGIVDKFIGDCVMAIWGYAVTNGERASQAFTCAKEMVGVAAAMEFGGEPIAIGVGLNAGRVFIGNIGGKGKRQFTVLGDPVNLASRYEAHSKILGSPIVIGEAVYQQLPCHIQSALISHHDQPIKGAKPQTVYTYSPRVSEEKGRIQ
jgi:class 3 adenylate cyclase